MWWSHLSRPALGLTHSQQPENFGLCIKPCFAHHEKPSMAAEARIQVLVFCTPSTLHCPSPSKPLAATMPWWWLLASWVCMAALPLGIIPPGAGVTAHSTRCCFSRQTALHKLLQVFQTKGAVQIRVGCFTSFLPVETSELFCWKQQLPMEISDSVEVTLSSWKYLSCSIQEFWKKPSGTSSARHFSTSSAHPGLGCSLSLSCNT